MKNTNYLNRLLSLVLFRLFARGLNRGLQRAMSQQSRLGQLSGIASSSRISLDSNHHHQQQSFNDRRDSSIPRELKVATTTGKYGEQSPLSLSLLYCCSSCSTHFCQTSLPS